ncbi:Asp23/Gls24 family envelope stress response protein [Yinghuangia sp. ASG 101]|uniref:Asp23/Gls24 family envelope stress response protein n=1 Tax=Yinghuangia sp. ASG 101 TaxID=2896848 RepID=UPI001E5E48FB|nr:Asp23/Gls24 family envelope stress response protein [Yinghuangia sp. ASG 101]UGQ11542.1 Asp23/Gls24 family envelope stress response protein [Yinghuangia sp. ASG 101]
MSTATKTKTETATATTPNARRADESHDGETAVAETGTDMAIVPQAGPADRGRTSIADPVVGKIAGMAAREVPGVHAFGGGLTRALGAVRDRVPGGRPSVTRGVKVEVGERQTAIDLEIVVEYGVAIAELAYEVRENVISAVERMTALEVVEVNIAVTDIHISGDDDNTGTRVE